MCRHCRHPDLRTLREQIRSSYDPIVVFGGDRKKAIKVIAAKLRDVKKNCKQARRDHLSTTYRVDYIYRLLRFAAFVLNSRTWDNGGNYFIG